MRHLLEIKQSQLGTETQEDREITLRTIQWVLKAEPVDDAWPTSPQQVSEMLNGDIEDPELVDQMLELVNAPQEQSRRAELIEESQNASNSHHSQEEAHKNVGRPGIASNTSNVAYLCPKCQDDIPTEYPYLLETQLSVYDDHTKLVRAGRACIVVGDFCHAHEMGPTQNLYVSGKRAFETSKYSCLRFVVVGADDAVAERPLKILHQFDFTAPAKHPGAFFMEGLQHFTEEFVTMIDWDWDMIYFWADGGLKTAINLHALWMFQTAIYTVATQLDFPKFPFVQANFFPAYHDRYNCDAHFGRKADLNEAQRPKNAHIWNLDDTVFDIDIPSNMWPVALSRTEPHNLGPDDTSLEQYHCALFDVFCSCYLLLYPYSAYIKQGRQPTRCYMKIEGIGGPLPSQIPTADPPNINLPWERAISVLTEIL